MNFKGVTWTACIHSTNSRRLPVTAQLMGSLNLVSSTSATQSSLCKHLTGSGWGTTRLPRHSGVLFLLSWGNRHLLLNISPDHLFYFFDVSFFRLFVHWEHWGIGDAEEAAFSLHRPWGPCWLFQPCPGSADPGVWLMAGGVCPELGLNIHRSLGSWFCQLCIGSSWRELYFYWLGSSDSWMWLHVAPVCWYVKLPLAR